jgi:hypothetical protein
MEVKILRKYNSEFRNNLKHKISKIVNKQDYIQIYKIINNVNDNKLSINRNGIYFNLNLLSDQVIDNIIFIVSNNVDTEIQSIIKYETYNKDTVIENFIHGHKLSNQEKSLLKKFHHK